MPRVLLRVTPGVEAHTHEFVRTGQDDSKFGFGAVDRRGRPRRSSGPRRSPSVELVGLHMHIGSQVFVADFFHQAVEVIAPFVGELGLPELSIGGGARRRLRRTARRRPTIVAVGARRSARRARRPASTARVTAEPGRAIVAAAAVTLYTVGTVKEIPASAPTCRSTAA